MTTDDKVHILRLVTPTQNQTKNRIGKTDWKKENVKS